MTTPLQPSFNTSLEHSTYLHELQMWQAAQTVRAHVQVDAGRASILECLGVSDARRPVLPAIVGLA